MTYRRGSLNNFRTRAPLDHRLTLQGWSHSDIPVVPTVNNVVTTTPETSLVPAAPLRIRGPKVLTTVTSSLQSYDRAARN